MVAERARQFAEKSPRLANGAGIILEPLERQRSADAIEYEYVSVAFDRAGRLASLTLKASDAAPPATAEEMVGLGASFWPLQLARELDDAILDIRNNEFEVAAILFKSSGAIEKVLAFDAFLDQHREHWLAREIRLLWKRVLKRLDMTSRTIVALVEPGSCFAGTLAEIVFAADRSYMFIGEREGDNRAPARIGLGECNFGSYPMANGLTRLQARFLADPEDVERARKSSARSSTPRRHKSSASSPSRSTTSIGMTKSASSSRSARSFSPDSLTGLEANLRFGGPETMESKIFARLTAWQNWIFQRPNAVGEEGALRRYGTGQKPVFDPRRV